MAGWIAREPAGLVWAFALSWFLFSEVVERNTYGPPMHRIRIARGHIEPIHEPLHPAMGSPI